MSPGIVEAASVAVDAGAVFAAVALPDGYRANGAFATVVGAELGMALGLDCGGVPAAARFAEDGGAAGCRVPASGNCGVDWAEGRSGAADFDSSEASASLVFHQAQRGPD
jgi:hypothetical protein